MDFKVFSTDELNTISKDLIISMYQQLAAAFQLLVEQNKAQNKKLDENERQMEKMTKQLDNLQEQLSVLTNYRFGRKTEKTAEIFSGQYTFDLKTGEPVLFNEVEFVAEDEPEKTDDQLLAEAKRRQARKRKKGVRDFDLRNVKHDVEEHRLSEEQLKEMFPEGYVEIGYDTSTRLEYTPAELVVIEDRIYKYKSQKHKNHFKRAPYPKRLFDHSYLMPSVAAKIIYDKYVNAVPLNRTAREFGWLNAVIRPPTMSRWMIRLTERYLAPIDQMMREEIKKARLIHADETPFKCVEDNKKSGRTKNSKSYMWVYHTADQYGSPPIFIYDYHDNRRTENVEKFLDGYQGYLMADGYEPYHTVARLSNGDIVVGGCWVHLKRKFTDVIKIDPKNAKGTLAYEGNKRIAKIYHEDNKMKNASEEDRLAYRREKIAPLVDEFFEWAKKYADLAASKMTREALTYAINQEVYLRKFLTSGIAPLDNSDAERSIRSFCLGKHSWHIISSSKGAETSAILYGIAETAKANSLKPYEYFKYLLEQLLEHEDDATEDLIRSLMAWSDSLPDELRVHK